MICVECGHREAIKGKNGHGTLCGPCKKNDPHRHRSRKLPEIICKVDCEGHDGQLISMSYGREDGTSNSIWTNDPRVAMRWMVDELSGHYTNTEGKEMRQIVGAFHFNWDTAVLSKAFDPTDMELIHKASEGKQKGGLICRAEHKRGDTCKGKLHAYNYGDIEAVITDGGEGDVIAWDRKSHLAFAATPKRRFYVEYRPNGDRFDGYKRVDIHDNGSAFVGSLLRVLEVWQPELTDEQRAIIEWGKAERHDGFLTGTNAQIMAYSEAECVADARCTRLLLDTISRYAGVPIQPDRLYGSGSVAGEAYRFHKVTKRKQTEVHDTYDLLARLCYFGGLIETPVVGIVEGTTNEEDINSAYPYAMQFLPCMRQGHGAWRQRKGGAQLPRNTLGYVRATWAVDTEFVSTPPFVVRSKDGRVFQPLSGADIWVTLPEYHAGRKRFPQGIVPEETIWWEQTCDCENQFAWMTELYDNRQAIKAQMKTLERGCPEWQALNCQQEAIKLVLNSGYGKLAQQRPTPGAYTNLHFAAFITGFTRAAVRQRTWQQERAGATVVYQHTDSVLFTGGKPKDGGNTLGAFGLEKPSHKFLVIQPGLAVALEGGKCASRGAPEPMFKEYATTWAAETDFTQHPSTWPKLELPRQMMVSRRLALHRGKPELAGCFIPMPLKIGVRHGKRDVVNAVPMPGNPTAWQLPPQLVIHNVATIDDLDEFMSSIDKRIKAGEWDG
jgi:hypothetical protein